ncbi:MAG: efflux RND transporter periplasmic adaptor subunit [Deltaproteobacteria bacterium]|nr:efflux RND transporter periplasmic adaptor subunit [Deltaproteobacteria bacterium]
MKQKPFAALVVFAVIAAGAYFVWRAIEAKDGGASGPRGFGPAPVVVAEAKTGDWTDELDAVGTARSRESVAITAKVTETVRRLHFEDGQQVKAGAILAELTRAEESAQLSEALAGFEDATKEYQRVSKLDSADLVAKTEVQTQTARYKAADARVRAIEARLSDRLIRAPFAGVVGLRNVSPGQLVAPGTVVATLDDISRIKLDFQVPETYVAVARPGLDVIARSEAYRDREFHGVITGMDTRVDPATRAFAVRAEIPNDDGALRPGMLLAVKIIRERRRTLIVPEGAIVQTQDRHMVFVATPENKAEQRTVKIGARKPGFVEITEGLAEIEQVVVEGAMKARPGGDVAIVGRVDALTGAALPMPESNATNADAPDAAKAGAPSAAKAK